MKRKHAVVICCIVMMLAVSVSTYAFTNVFSPIDNVYNPNLSNSSNFMEGQLLAGFGATCISKQILQQLPVPEDAHICESIEKTHKLFLKSAVCL